MIVELLLDLVFGAVYLLTRSLPNTVFDLPDWSLQALKLLKTGICFFPTDVWIACIANGMFWLVVHFVWAIIEWVYKKIPGVD